MEKSKLAEVLNGILFGILALIFATALGLGIIHVTNFPYLVDVKALSISEASGISDVEIMENYNAVMDYLSPFSSAEFDLPTLKYSAEGAAHFADCHRLFKNFYYLGVGAALFLFYYLYKFRGKRGAASLKLAGFVTLAIPLAMGAAIALSFDRVFVLFHKVFFNDDTWIFDPAVDEIIKILPAEFFMHCAMFIAAFWVIAAVGIFALAFRKEKAAK